MEKSSGTITEGPLISHQLPVPVKATRDGPQVNSGKQYHENYVSLATIYCRNITF